MLGGQPAAEAFAWRSPRARQLGLDPARPPSDDELVRLMLAVPYLIRRPVIRMRKETLFGFDQRRVEALLAGE